MGLNQIRPSTREVALMVGQGLAEALKATESTGLLRAPSSATTHPSGLAGATPAFSTLPRQGQNEMGEIREGRPLRYGQESMVSGNREPLVPGGSDAVDRSLGSLMRVFLPQVTGAALG
jgi:guanyl-specific ribonuclease Sa